MWLSYIQGTVSSAGVFSTKIWLKDWSILGKGWECLDYSVSREKSSHSSIWITNRSVQRKQPDSFSVVPNDRTSNGHKLEKHEFPSDNKNILFLERVSKHWNMMASEVMESASAEIWKTHLDMILESLLESTLL